MSETTIPPAAAPWIRRWLILVGLMVYAMILIGGATRLTDSGLSITEWDPIKGAIPPPRNETRTVPSTNILAQFFNCFCEVSQSSQN